MHRPAVFGRCRIRHSPSVPWTMHACLRRRLGTVVSRSCWVTSRTTKKAGWTSSRAATRSSAYTGDQTEVSTVWSGVLEHRRSTSAANSVSRTRTTVFYSTVYTAGIPVKGEFQGSRRNWTLQIGSGVNLVQNLEHQGEARMAAKHQGP